jgi:hypothetical protein
MDDHYHWCSVFNGTSDSESFYIYKIKSINYDPQPRRRWPLPPQTDSNTNKCSFFLFHPGQPPLTTDTNANGSTGRHSESEGDTSGGHETCPEVAPYPAITGKSSLTLFKFFPYIYIQHYYLNRLTKSSRTMPSNRRWFFSDSILLYIYHLIRLTKANPCNPRLGHPVLYFSSIFIYPFYIHISGVRSHHAS